MGKKSKHKKQRNQQRQQTRVAQEPSAAAAAVHMSRATGLELGEQFTRRDVLRVLILIGVVTLALIALVVIDTQSSFVLDAGRKLASILRLS